MFRSRNIRLGNHSINFESYDVMIILGFDGLGCKSFGHGTWLTKNYNCRQFLRNILYHLKDWIPNALFNLGIISKFRF